MQKATVDRRYELGALLGAGGMARVYLAHDRVLNRDLALKVLREQYAENEEFVERFRREARSAAALTHPNIVSVYDWGRSGDGFYYMAMEHVPGGTLKERILREGPLNAETAASFGIQIAAALEAAHSSGVIHRDVKPQNILLAASGDAKVADFGIARAASAPSISRTSMVMGTASYMSPEQAMGEPVGPASDLYSLGVVLYEMLTGGLPFDAETPVGVAMRHVNEPLRPPEEAEPGVPEGIGAVTVKLLAKSPGDRFRSAAELIGELRRVRDGLAPDAGDDRAPTVRIRRSPAGSASSMASRRRAKPLLAAAVTLSLLGTAGLGLWKGNFDQGGSPELSRSAVLVKGAVEIPDTRVQVPDVRGFLIEKAEKLLTSSGFEAAVRLRESSRDDAGRVLEQSPSGGAAEKGSKVTITVGNGPQQVEVPDLTGLTAAGAENRLNDAGLKAGYVAEIPSDAVRDGELIAQGIPAGTDVETGTAVNLTVSSGPEQLAGQAQPSPQPAPAAPVQSIQQPAPATPVQPAPQPAPAVPVQPAPQVVVDDDDLEDFDNSGPGSVPDDEDGDNSGSGSGDSGD